MRKRLIIYFLLVAAESVCLGAVIPFELADHRSSALSLVAVLVIGSTIVMLVHHTVKPIDHAVDAMRNMAEGRLDDTVRQDQKDQIGEIGKLMNEISANQQEILLHIFTHTEHIIDGSKRVDDLTRSGNTPEDLKSIRESAGRIRQNAENMQAMVRDFSLYDIRLNAGKISAVQELADTGGSRAVDSAGS